MEFDLSTSKRVMDNLNSCAADLKSWNSNVYRQIPKKILTKRNTLNSLTLQDKDGTLSTEINSLRREINDLLDNEELLGAKSQSSLAQGG